MKLLPFRQWIRQSIEDGTTITSYVAIRSDEDHREGYTPKQEGIAVRYPFRESKIDKQGVVDLLGSSGLGLPKYYDWRSRSGCTFCFFQQKIEWVNLKRKHPDAFEEAKGYEKTALDHGSPFTWSQGESLTELEQPERIAEIEADFRTRRLREHAQALINPLRPYQYTHPIDNDELFGDDEGRGACLVCHK